MCHTEVVAACRRMPAEVVEFAGEVDSLTVHIILVLEQGGSSALN